jgi:heptosyltransferase-2
MSPLLLILKTAALGDVLRTTSILPGLRERMPEARIEWVTAPGARDLVEGHAEVAAVHTVDPTDPVAVRTLAQCLGEREYEWVLSLDEEALLCELASSLPTRRLSGAYLDGAGVPAYTKDVAPWFDMGLLSVHGKAAADRLKVANHRSHAELHASMLGIPMGRPGLPLPSEALARAGRTLGASEGATRIGLNTGAGGRWVSKQLSVERTAEFAGLLRQQLSGPVHFVLLGGMGEAVRNRQLCELLRGEGVSFTDPGTENSILDFAALIDGLDLLLTSDSLAMHLAISRETPLVAFFAPTSAAEIELYGLGEKVRSTAPDYCSYLPEVDTSSLTPERLAAAALRVLAARHSS